MSLKVLSVGYPLAPVARNTAGGAEQILSILDEAVVSAGHESLVIAPAGSACYGTLLPITPTGTVLDDDRRAFARLETQRKICWALNHYEVDVIHLHGIDFLAYMPGAGIPVVVTLHLPPSWYPERAFQLSRPDTYLVCVSSSQRRECPPGAHVYEVIPNGIRLNEFAPQWEKGDYVVALGRICPEKGFHLAVDAADQAGVPLFLAGTVFGYKAHTDYFEQVLRPKLKGDHRFVAAVGGRRKQELLAGARCLVVPSLVSETSSLVAMEAIACGTPVVAFRRGALPEIVQHGRTGFLVDDVDDMAKAIDAARDLSPSVCREYAEANFSSIKMAERYLHLYRSISAAQSSYASEQEHAA